MLVHRYSRDAIYIPKASVLEGVKHPNIQRFLFQCEDAEGFVIHAFTFIDGRTLLELLKEASPELNIFRRIRILYDLACGLCYLHGFSLLHGDIKPSNVMLRNGDLRAIWIDLCALPAISADTNLPYFGTPPYISNEVLEGSYPTPASEVFAFGILCLACLSGVLPPPEPRPPKAWQYHCLDKIRSLDKTHSLTSALVRALSEDPANRPQTLEIKEALKKLI